MVRTLWNRLWAVSDRPLIYRLSNWSSSTTQAIFCRIFCISLHFSAVVASFLSHCWWIPWTVESTFFWFLPRLKSSGDPCSTENLSFSLWNSVPSKTLPYTLDQTLFHQLKESQEFSRDSPPSAAVTFMHLYEGCFLPVITLLGCCLSITACFYFSLFLHKIDGLFFSYLGQEDKFWHSYYVRR